MDYSHAAYFAGTQPYQFIGIPPLTPSHSNSAPSEDYNTTSPPEVFTEFPNEHHQQQPQQQRQQQQQQQQQQQLFGGFDGLQGYNPQPAFPGPPTPPTHGLPGQPALNGGANGQIAADLMALAKSEPGLDAQTAAQQQRGGSNSEEDELTPAQSRRKAQNRAAQRAFRERKERHVKDLEAKLASLEAAQAQTATENERLKRDLQKISTENEILRATSAMGSGSSPGGGAPTTTGPLTYNPTDFYTDLLAHHDNKTPSHRVATSASGERLLAAGATWDLIINHEAFKRGLVDVQDISNRLKFQAKCDGQGPVFEESAIMMAIEQSVGSGSDQLI